MQAGASSIAAYDDGEKHVPFLQRHVVGPARFLIFLLSLALLAHRDDKELSQSRQHGRRRRKKRRCRITKRESSRSRQIKADKGYASDSAASDSSVGSSTKKRVLHTHQRKLGLLEVGHTHRNCDS